MKSTVFRTFAVFVLSLAIVNTGLISSAQAAIVDTSVLVPSSRQADMDSISAQLARADVQRGLEQLGVAPQSIENRIAALNDAELRQLASEMRNAPAGGDALAVIGIVFLVLLILEVVGVIDIFSKFP
jgi:hypothetical protein